MSCGMNAFRFISVIDLVMEWDLEREQIVVSWSQTYHAPHCVHVEFELQCSGQLYCDDIVFVFCSEYDAPELTSLRPGSQLPFVS